ncbi:hypothetical protein ACTFIY_004573 [Dictyostelium cf. discoideum]
MVSFKFSDLNLSCNKCGGFNIFNLDPKSKVRYGFICDECYCTMARCNVSGCEVFLMNYNTKKKSVPICKEHYYVYFPPEEDYKYFHPDSLNEEIPFSDSDTDDSDTDLESDSYFNNYKYSDPKNL